MDIRLIGPQGMPYLGSTNWQLLDYAGPDMALYRPITVPEPYQAGTSPDAEGHFPGCGCITRTCDWSYKGHGPW